MTVDQFCLKWNNYQASLTNAFKSLLENEDFVDVTLSAGGKTLRAHKVVLSACSSYFKQLLRGISSWQHPILFLRDVPFVDLYTILEFIYMGEVNVAQSDLTSFLKTAELLQIKGLAENVNWSGEDLEAAAAGQQPGHKRRRLSSEASNPPAAGKILNDSVASAVSNSRTGSVDNTGSVEDIKKEAQDDDNIDDDEESALCVDESAEADGELLLTSEEHNGLSSSAGSSPVPRGVLMGPNHKKCEQCDIVMLKKNFARHQRDMHTEPKPRSLCPLCQKSYKTSDWLKDHIRRGHGYTKELTDQLMATIRASPVKHKTVTSSPPPLAALENSQKTSISPAKQVASKRSVAVIDIQQQPMTILNSEALSIVKQENITT